MELVKNETQGNTLQVFNCELGQVRVIVENGEPYFMASDLCQALEYKNGRDTINRLFQNDVAKYYAGVETGKKADGTPAIQNKLCTFLTEAQMYKLIMRSKAKRAEEFQDWICGEVLPSIRKTGSYQVKPLLDTSDPIAVLEALKDSVEKQIVLLKENKVLKIENAEKQGRLDDYKAIERTRRSKGELSASINRNIRKIAQERFNNDYKKAYRYVYDLFAKRHLINEKINMQYLKKNNDHLAEVLEITLSEMD